MSFFAAELLKTFAGPKGKSGLSEEMHAGMSWMLQKYAARL